MPSKSLKQHQTMQAACHSADFADKIGIDQKTACEYVEADKKAGKWQKKPRMSVSLASYNDSTSESKLYHGSNFKTDILKPGFDVTGILTEWDGTESNQWLYASTSRLEAIEMAFASALEKRFEIERFQSNGKTFRIHIRSGKRKPRLDELHTLKIYLYTVPLNSEWVKVDNKQNKSTTEYKTRSHIFADNFEGSVEIDVAKWLKNYKVEIVTIPHPALESLPSLSW